MEGLTEDIKIYWANRSDGYSKVNKDELACEQKRKWLKAIEKKIGAKEKASVKFLTLEQDLDFFPLY